MKPSHAPSRAISISAVTHYNDGSKSRGFYWVSPIDEAACQGVVRSLLSCLFEAPVDEGGTPSSLVSTPPPVTKIECCFEVLENPEVMPTSPDFPDTQFTLGED
jgi:hypothetical protein